MNVQAPASTGLLPPTDKAILVYTDGGCDPKKNAIGAWAFVAVPPGKTLEHAVSKSGGMCGTTNNRMELLAVISALEEVEIGPRVIITSDSEYVVKGATAWVDGWVKKGWKTYAGAPVKNRDLWERLMALRDLHNVRFDWVKGHAGNPLNEMCDELCTETMLELHVALEQGGGVELDHGAMA